MSSYAELDFTVDDPATYKAGIDLNTFLVRPAGALARSAGGIMWQNIGMPCPPSLEIIGHLWKDLANGYDSSVFTFTRATTATYFGQDGLRHAASSGELRHAFDPLTRRYKGMLLEGAATNLLYPSNDLTGWTASYVTITANQGADSYGNTTLEKLEDSNTSNVGYVSKSFSLSPAGATYAASITLRRGTALYTFLDLKYIGGTTKRGTLIFNWTTETVADMTGFTPAAKGVTKLSDDLFRVWVATTDNNTGNTSCVVSVAPACGSNGNVATNTGYIDAGELQVEVVTTGGGGIAPTSYIPTTASAATRNADALSAAVSGFANNPGQGSFVAAFQRNVKTTSGTARIFEMYSDATHGIAAYLPMGTDDVTVAMANGGNYAICLMDAGDLEAETEYVMGVSFADNDLNASLDGATVVNDDSTVDVPSMTTLVLGNGSAGATPLNGCISHFAYFPQAPADSALLRRASA